MRQGFILRANVPFSEPNSHSIQVSVVHAVACRHNPPLGDERAAARDPFAEKALLDHGNHPRVASEGCVLASHNSVTACVNLPTFWEENILKIISALITVYSHKFAWFILGTLFWKQFSYYFFYMYFHKDNLNWLDIHFASFKTLSTNFTLRW